MKKTVDNFSIEVTEGGYPAWVDLSAGGENALTNMTVRDLEDIIYLLQWALNRAKEIEGNDGRPLR